MVLTPAGPGTGAVAPEAAGPDVAKVTPVAASSCSWEWQACTSGTAAVVLVASEGSCQCCMLVGACARAKAGSCCSIARGLSQGLL